MLELMKELGFIPESRALKLSCNQEGKIFGERYDRVTYLREVFSSFTLHADSPVYVEAGRFMPLLPYIKTAVKTPNYLQVTLLNDAEYKLPYLDIEFNRPDISGEPVTEIEGAMDLSVLKKTALQNLVKPEMRCIYVDSEGAVSCNFLQGTVDNRLKSVNPLLLPPEMIDYFQAEERGTLYSFSELLCYTDGSKWVWAPKVEIPSDDEQPWYFTIRNSAQSVLEESFVSIPSGMEDAIKRLQYFGTEAEFSQDKVSVGENYEPMSLPGSAQGTYSLEEVSTVIALGKKIAFANGAMFLKNEKVTILVSEKEDE